MQIKRLTDLQHVLHITLQAGVAFAIECRQIRLAAAHKVKENLAVRGGKGWRHSVPHGLVATKPVGI